MATLVPLNYVGSLAVPNPKDTPANDEQDQQEQVAAQVMSTTSKLELELEDTIIRKMSERAQWLRAAVLGANDGLVSVASLMMGVGAVRSDSKAMLLAGFAGSVAGASSMAIGEFVSVYTQFEVELIAQIKNRDMNKKMEKRALPNPFQAAFASALAFSIGALFPLLSAAFITNNNNNHNLRLFVVVAVASFALVRLEPCWERHLR